MAFLQFQTRWARLLAAATQLYMAVKVSNLFGTIPYMRLHMLSAIILSSSDEIPQDMGDGGSPTTIILAVLGTVGILALAALILVVTYSVRKQQQARNRR